MKNVYVCLATGFEEIEALTPVDILRRAGIYAKLVSITGNEIVTGARNINVKADLLFENIDKNWADILVLPGGMPGTTNLLAYEPLMALVKEYNENKKNIAAICAAPTILGKIGLLEGKKATCYPGMEADLIGAEAKTDSVVVDGNIITSRGMGTALDFSLELLSIMTGSKEEAKSMAEKVVYDI